MTADLPTDQIEVRGLVVAAFCGVLPEEQARRQPFRIDLDLHVDLAAAGASDGLDDTVDYGAVSARIGELAEELRCQLMEHFAQRVADLALGFDGVVAVTVAITKLRPPLPEVVDTTGVRIHRARS